MTVDIWPFEKSNIFYKYDKFIESMDFNNLFRDRSKISIELFFVSKLKMIEINDVAN